MDSFVSDEFLGHAGSSAQGSSEIGSEVFELGDLHRRMATGRVVRDVEQAVTAQGLGCSDESADDSAAGAEDSQATGEPGGVCGEIVVRAAELADVPDIIELAAQLATHSMSPFRSPDSESVIDNRRDDLQSLYQMWWAPDIGIYVARDESNRLLGHVLVKVGGKEFLTGEEQAWIYDIAVVPELWGSGLSKRLMEAAEEYATERGMGYLGLTVTCTNLRAAKFYKNMGYQDERIQMVKLLNPVVPEEIQ